MSVEVEYDRAKEVKQFEESKMGVKGLVDSGITSIPRLFVYPPESRPRPAAIHKDPNVIPVVDLSGADSGRRSVIVDQIRHTLRTSGLFQIINHGIPCKEVLDSTISAVKAFHEQPTEMKSPLYAREMESGISFYSNLDLAFNSKPASWRDTLLINFGPEALDSEKIPEICRKELVQWDQHTSRLVELLMELIWEGLGLAEIAKSKKMTCLEGRSTVGLIYPYCPEPDLTVGVQSHTDPGVLTMLLQDQIGGLQVKHEEDWVDVKPIVGALVINAGDFLQILSNDEYVSAEHRVLANPFLEPRISIASFFNYSNMENVYGPLPELVSPEKPAVYRSFTFPEFLERYIAQDLDGQSLRNYYKI